LHGMIVRQSAGIFCKYEEDSCAVISSAYGFGEVRGLIVRAAFKIHPVARRYNCRDHRCVARPKPNASAMPSARRSPSRKRRCSAGKLNGRRRKERRPEEMTNRGIVRIRLIASIVTTAILSLSADVWKSPVKRLLTGGTMKWSGWSFSEYGICLFMGFTFLWVMSFAFLWAVAGAARRLRTPDSNQTSVSR